jgi:WD40 repeat protein
VASKRPSVIYQGHNSQRVFVVAWSPDDKRIASGGGNGDGTVQVWNAADGEHVYTYKGHQVHEKSLLDQTIETASVTAISWSPDGQHIASGSVSPQPDVQIWDAANGGHTRKLGSPDQMGKFAVYLAWSPNGMYLATNPFVGDSPEEALIWDMKGQYSPVGSVEGGSSNWTPTALAWSPDSRYLAFAGYVTLSGNIVHIWDTTDRRLLTKGFTETAIDALAWSHDGKFVASGSDNTVQIWEPLSGKTIFTYHGHTDNVRGLDWSPDGKRIVSLSSKDGARVWGVANGKLFATYSENIFTSATISFDSSQLNAVAWSHDGKHIACAGDNGYVQIWQAPE